MDKGLLIEMREDFVKSKEKQKEMILLFDELERLREDPNVKRYLALVEFDNVMNRKLISKRDYEILVDLYFCYRHKIRATNGIYFCEGTYKYNSGTDREHGVVDKLVARDDISADYRVYRNIEDEFDCYHILIKDCEVFEREHKVIYAKGIYSGNYEYNSIQMEFFCDLMTIDQDEAVRKVLSRKK